MQGPYDVEFRTISVSRELREHALEQQRLLDEAKLSESCEPQGTTRSALRGFVQGFLGFARPGRQWAEDGASARESCAASPGDASQNGGARRSFKYVSEHR
jgi:hypothetical protein